MANKLFKISLIILVLMGLVLPTASFFGGKNVSAYFIPEFFSISDSPDPFNPLFEKTNIVISLPEFFTFTGEITLSIEGINKSWHLNLEDSTGVQILWDGRDNLGNIVPAGTYSYTLIASGAINGGEIEEIHQGTITVLPMEKKFWYREAKEERGDAIIRDYDIIQASIIHNGTEILDLLSSEPVPLGTEILLAKIELPEAPPSQNYSGVGVRIYTDETIYLLGFCTSPTCYGPHLLVSQDGGLTWQEISGNFGGWIYDGVEIEGSAIFLWVKMENIGPLPWKVDFLSGIVFSPTEYHVLDQTETIEIPIEAPEKWSFAIITDLHIGYDIPDYDGATYNDGQPPEENYYLVERLKKIIERVNELKGTYNIKFVSVLGDISDTAEYSELLKARNILNILNDPNGDGDLADGIPYIPLIGNHDVWPYTQKEGIDPDNRGEENHATISLLADGDEYFERIFWCSPYVIWWPGQESYKECLENNTNLQKIQEAFDDTWQRQEEMEEYRYDSVFLENYTFEYKDLDFLVIDSPLRNARPGSLWNALGWIYQPTLKWGNEHPFDVLFSHIPRRSVLNSSPWFPENNRWFAGHVHERGENDNTRSLTFWGSIITERWLQNSFS